MMLSQGPSPEKHLPISMVILPTVFALVAFGSNSLLCRLALKQMGIDPVSFTSLRILSGALTLGVLLVARRATRRPLSGSWLSALMLFLYAAGFSYAYVRLSTATGALILFGTVQVTMISSGIVRGERLTHWQWGGFWVALGGLVYFLFPGLSAPPWREAALMVSAGVAWGGYSLRAKGVVDPIETTAGNFLRGALLTILLSLVTIRERHLTTLGVTFALISGSITSALGYVIWYTALRTLKATQAAVVQLAVPILAALAGIVVVGEPVTQRLLRATVIILGGIALAIRKEPSKPTDASKPRSERTEGRS